MDTLRNQFRQSKRDGFSLIDLVVLVAIAIVVITLVVMRVSGDREFSRRIGCENNLRQIFLANESYSLRYGHFPIGTQNPTGPIHSVTSGYHHNWITGLLPMLDEQQRFDQIDFRFGVYAPENAEIAATAPSILRCAASLSTLAPNATTYAGVSSSLERPIDETGDGMLILNRALSARDASDGASFVLLVGEKARDIGMPTQWNSGTRASLRTAGHQINSIKPTAADLPSGGDAISSDVTSGDVTSDDELYVGGFSSNHIGGAYFLFVDGSFRLFSDETDLAVLHQMAGRADETRKDLQDTPPNEPAAAPQDDAEK